MFFFPSLAHEGSEGFCWDITAGSDRTAGPDCVLPGSRDQGHTPEVLLRPEGPAELTLPDWVLLRRPRWGKTPRLQSDCGRPLLKNGEFSLFVAFHGDFHITVKRKTCFVWLFYLLYIFYIILFIAAFVLPQANIYLYYFLPVLMATAVAVELLNLVILNQLLQYWMVCKQLSIFSYCEVLYLSSESPCSSPHRLKITRVFLS